MSAQMSELARLRAENAALRLVVDACVKAIDDLEVLSRTPHPATYQEAVRLILDCLTPIADMLDAVGELADGGVVAQ